MCLEAVELFNFQQEVCQSPPQEVSNEYHCKPRILRSSLEKNSAYCILNLCSPHSLFYETHDTDSVEHQLDCTLTFHSDARTCVVGYSNGLCCILEDAEEFILWNPSTRKSRTLPPVYEEEFLWIDEIGGFGFDKSTDDYKILAVVRTQCPGGGCCSFKFIPRLYSLSSNSWKTLDDFLEYGAFKGMGVLVNKFHWAARVGVCAGMRSSIVSFDLASEAVGSVEPPSYVVEGFYLCPALSVLDRCLCILCGNKKDWTDIWVMKEYGVKESWCKLVRVSTIPGVHTCGYPYQTFTPLCISPEGKVLLLQGSSLIIYDPKEKSLRYPQNKTNFDRKEKSLRYPQNMTNFDQVGFYNESLVSPFSDGEGELQD